MARGAAQRRHLTASQRLNGLPRPFPCLPPSLNSGAVAAIGPVANPVSVARMVMQRTPHCLLVGEGATRFAQQQGVPLLRSSDLVTAEAEPQQ